MLEYMHSFEYIKTRAKVLCSHAYRDQMRHVFIDVHDNNETQNKLNYKMCTTTQDRCTNFVTGI